MSDTSLNLIVQTVDTNITLDNNQLSVTPTAIELNLGLEGPGPSVLSFDVQPVASNLVMTTNTIDFTPSAVNMNVFGGGIGVPGGNTTTVQFNNGGQLGGIPNVKWDGSNLSLGNIANVKLSGGTANYVIKTDGNGNLSWGTPTISGANTTVQYNNNGQLGGSNSFTFNNTSNTMTVTNIRVGAYYYANGQPLNLSNTYSNSNVAAYLFNSGLFTGAVNNRQTPGSTITTTTGAAVGREAFASVNSIGAIEGTIRGFTNDATHVYGCLRNYIVRSTDGQNWEIVFTHSTNFVSMAYNGTYRVAVGSNGSIAYSNNGTSWAADVVGSNPWVQVLVSGTTFLMCGASGIYSSTNPSNVALWVQRNATAVVDMAIAGSTIVAITATAGVYSNNITTWSTIGANTFVLANSIVSNGTTFVVSRGGLTGTFWKSTNGSAWTSFTITLDTVTLIGTILYSYSLGAWYLRSTGFNGLVVDVASFDLLAWSYRNIVYLGQEPGVNAIREDFTVGAINLISCADVTSMRKLPQNLIYTDLATMTAAPVGNYQCIGPVSANFEQSLYMWLKA